jgi:hypothetical protein
MFAAFCYRLGHDTLLEEVQFARLRVRLLFDRRQKQGVQFGVPLLNLPGDMAIIRLPTPVAAQDHYGNDDGQAGEGDLSSPEVGPEITAQGEERQRQQGENAPAQSQSFATFPLPLPPDDRFELGFEQSFSHGFKGLSTCPFYTSGAEKQ